MIVVYLIFDIVNINGTALFTYSGVFDLNLPLAYEVISMIFVKFFILRKSSFANWNINIIQIQIIQFTFKYGHFVHMLFFFLSKMSKNLKTLDTQLKLSTSYRIVIYWYTKSSTIFHGTSRALYCSYIINGKSEQT